MSNKQYLPGLRASPRARELCTAPLTAPAATAVNTIIIPGENDVDDMMHFKIPPKVTPTNAAPPLSPPAPDLTTSRSFRLHLLSPSIEIDVKAADYSTAYPRLCSIEYLTAAVICFSLLVYGFTILMRFCNENFREYEEDLLVANGFFDALGSKGYDDVLDAQWTGFITQYPYFALLALILGAFSRVCRRLFSPLGASPPFSPANAVALSQFVDGEELSELLESHTQPSVQTGEPLSLRPLTHTREPPSPSRCSVVLHDHPWVLPAFYAIAGAIFLGIAHGPHFFLPLLIITANYIVFTRLQRVCPYWLFMTIMWVTHVGLLYIVSVNNGFEQTYWVQQLFTSPKTNVGNSTTKERIPLWNSAMRWSVAFRMTTLRLIAFNYDLWEATHAASRARERATVKHDTTCVECAQLRQQNAASLPAEASRCYKYRTEYSRDVADYTFVNYAAYVLFPPLYIAGPMSSFNAFVSHMRVPSTSMPPWKMLGYAFSILRIYAIEYFLLHFIHVTCLGKHTALFFRMKLVVQGHFLIFSLAYLWLKFSFLWKSSRLFAMLSGIEAPEDMRRCFANTHTVREFWRDWHASFNLWVVRYMYIPMGGRNRVALSVLPIFLFIAIWHDPILHLVKWAVCIALMFVLELVVSGYFERVVAAFRREMADAAESLTPTEGNNETKNDRHMGHAQSRTPLARLARFSAHNLTPRAQSWIYRQLRVLGGMSIVLGLIFANVMGFSAQNAFSVDRNKESPLAPGVAEYFVKDVLSDVTPLFTLGLIAGFYCSSTMAVIDRDLCQQKTSWLKSLYRLR